MRRRARLGPGAQNLDSFLDIMTNTVGVLVFVLLFVTLSAADASVLVRTPLRQESKKDALFFEVRGTRVLHVDTEKVNADIERLRRRLPEINLYTYEYAREMLEGFQTSTQDYRVRMAGSIEYGLGLTYTARPDAGVPLASLADTGAEYAAILGASDPAKVYLAFIVRPDGFEAFREARKIAWEKGYQVGWEPFTQDRTLSLGASGRTVGVQ
jgi:hypothetical protein